MREHLVARGREIRKTCHVEHTALVGVRRASDLLLGVGHSAKQAELGIGAGDEVLEAVGHPRKRILRGRGNVGRIDHKLCRADRALDALDEFLLPFDVLGGLGAEDPVFVGGQRAGLLALGVFLGLDQ